MAMRRGDVVTLGGKHRLMCGDAGDQGDVAKLFAGAQPPDLVFTSPPYLSQRVYSQAIPCWDTLMQRVFGAMPHHDRTQVLVNLGLVHRKGEWLPYWDNWVAWMRQREWRRFGWYVWDKKEGLPGDFNGRLAPSFDHIFHFCKKSIRPAKVTPCRHAGNRRINGNNALRSTSKERVPQAHDGRAVQPFKIGDSVFRVYRDKSHRTNHPAVFPVALPAAVHAAYSQPGQLVYEPFAGAGTSILAAEQGGRVCYGMEISSEYCDAAVERWHRIQDKARAAAPKRRFGKVVAVPPTQGTLW